MPQEFAERFRPEGEETPEARAKREQEAKAWRETNVWAPNQLRHSAATEFRKKAGAEASRVALGHAHLSTTEIYAEKDLDAAIRLARGWIILAHLPVDDGGRALDIMSSACVPNFFQKSGAGRTGSSCTLPPTPLHFSGFIQDRGKL